MIWLLLFKKLLKKYLYKKSKVAFKEFKNIHNPDKTNTFVAGWWCCSK